MEKPNKVYVIYMESRCARDILFASLDHETAKNKVYELNTTVFNKGTSGVSIYIVEVSLI